MFGLKHAIDNDDGHVSKETTGHSFLYASSFLINQNTKKTAFQNEIPFDKLNIYGIVRISNGTKILPEKKFKL